MHAFKCLHKYAVSKWQTYLLLRTRARTHVQNIERRDLENKELRDSTDEHIARAGANCTRKSSDIASCGHKCKPPIMLYTNLEPTFENNNLNQIPKVLLSAGFRNTSGRARFSPVAKSQVRSR